MSKQEKKRRRIYYLLNAETKPNVLCLPFTHQRKGISQQKSFLRKRGSIGWNKKKQEGFLTAFAKVIEKDPTMSIRKHTRKSTRTAINQEWSPGHNPLDYTIWGVLENKANATSYPNIGYLKRLKKLFLRHGNPFEGILKHLFKKIGGHIE